MVLTMHLAATHVAGLAAPASKTVVWQCESHLDQSLLDTRSTHVDYIRYLSFDWSVSLQIVISFSVTRMKWIGIIFLPTPRHRVGTTIHGVVFFHGLPGGAGDKGTRLLAPWIPLLTSTSLHFTTICKYSENQCRHSRCSDRARWNSLISESSKLRILPRSLDASSTARLVEYR